MISQVEHVLKEAAESVFRGIIRGANGASPEQLASLLSDIRTRGYAVVHEFWTAEQCVTAREHIDAQLAGETACKRWTDAEGSDQRLYFAERIGGDLEAFFNDPFIRSMRKRYVGFEHGDSLLLVNRLKVVAGNKGSGGGWHRDSPHRSQFKALMYLSDVTAQNGPFEYLDESHLAGASVRLMRAGKTKPNQYRFTNDEIQAVIAAGAKCTTFTAPAGTLLLVDTKGIHRGRPIEAATRYAATHYYWDRARPKDFLP